MAHASNQPIYFISDLHFGAKYQGLKDNRENIFIQFLEERASQASHLFILGDLFEFWMEYHSYIPKEHFRVLSALERLANQGVAIHYLSGNHDFNLGSFFQNTLNIKTYTQPTSFDLQGQKLLLLHGDGLAKSDWKYRLMNKIMVHPLSNFFFKLIHPDWGMALARSLSGLSRDQHHNRPRFMDEYEAASRALLKKGGENILIHGHTHAAFVKTFPEGVYVNSGEWLFNLEYVTMENGTCRIEKFTPENLAKAF